MTKDGITTFVIRDKQCSHTDYGDGRGESDCHNGNVREIFSYCCKATMGQAISYKFDVLVDPSFAYSGFYNDHSLKFIPDGLDSRLRIASWEGQFLHNFLYELKVDNRHGISFLSQECQPRAEFGNWVTFEMRVRWVSDKTGWIRAICNHKEIYAAKNLATNQAPQCYITNQCEPDKKKYPTRIIYSLGPVMAGFGPEWQIYGKSSQFTDIQPEGITVKMRNISVTPIKN